MSTRLEELKSLLQEDPNDVFVLYAIALEYFKIGNSNQAIQNLQDLIDASPDYIPAYFRLGQWFADQDDIEKAKNVLNQALLLCKNQNDAKAAQEIKELLLFIEDYED